MSGAQEPPREDPGSVPLVIVGFGGFLTIATGLSITILAYVLVNTVTDGRPAIAAVSLVGILVGVAIYYVGMGELFQSGP